MIPALHPDPKSTPSADTHTNTHSQRLQTVQSVEAFGSHGNNPIVVEMPVERERG